MDLAKQQADKPEEDDNDLRKKLWLRIGENECPLCMRNYNVFSMIRTVANSAESACLLNVRFNFTFFVQ